MNMAQSKDVERRAVFTRLFGNNLAWARNKIAAGLIRLGIGPNLLTILGMLVTFGAGFFLALGAGDKPGSGIEGKSWYGVVAASMLIFASAFDILDGAVARLGKQKTQSGAFLDSCCDRVADGAIFLGIMIYYFRNLGIPCSIYWASAAIIALINAECISYVKARAENFIESCPVGYWQRGERMAAILIGLFSGHTATVMVMLAVLPAFTVLRRIIFGFQQMKRQEIQAMPSEKNNLSEPMKLTGIYRWALWRYRRGTLQYDIITAFNICMILFVDLQG